VESFVTLDNPYSYAGTSGSWDEEKLHGAFAKATVIKVASESTRFGVTYVSAVSDTSNEIWNLNLVKVGAVNRKDDLLEGGKKAMNRKWKPWSMILTGSQLLLFRETTWANTLLTHSSNGQAVFPQNSVFKPDELLSVKDTITVFDKSYRKVNELFSSPLYLKVNVIQYPNTLRFVMPNGRQFLLQTSDETELNEWISYINYASAFISAGVQMRPTGMSSRDVQMTGVAAANAHLHDVQMISQPIALNVRRDVSDSLPRDSSPGSVMSPGTTPCAGSDLDLDVPVIIELEGADQLKVTFDRVKAHLATGHWTSSDESSSISSEKSGSSRVETFTASPFPSSNRNDYVSRSPILRSKIRDLESKISEAETQLTSDLRFLRNVGTMTPFQRATRERLQLAVQNVAKRIMQVRLDLAKYSCHRDVLSDDLASEERDRQRTNKMALRAATETIQSRCSANIPRMTLSYHEDSGGKSSPRLEFRDIDGPRRSESSLCESFYSAVDSGLEWHRPCVEVPSTYLSTNRGSNSPAASSSIGSLVFPEGESEPRLNVSESRPASSECDIQLSLTGNSVGTTDRVEANKKIADEQAEDWNKTRCAQRVSLVRMPSDMRLSTFFRDSKHNFGDDS
jgi:hypothetical protein